jgi:hypothetical protein
VDKRVKRENEIIPTRTEFRMFVRKRKIVGGGYYYQLVENYQSEGAKAPRLRVLLHLGHYETVADALEGWKSDIKRHRQQAHKLRADFDSYPEEEKSLPKVRYLLGQAAGHERAADELEAKLEQLHTLVAQRSNFATNE